MQQQAQQPVAPQIPEPEPKAKEWGDKNSWFGDEAHKGMTAYAYALHEEAIKDNGLYGFVLDMGPDAYANHGRFPTGPFCKKGDWIVMRSYSGTRFLVHGREFRLINDDSVEAVVEDPRGIVKV